MSNYLKAGMQVLATAVAAVAAGLAGDNHVDASEWINVGILAFGALAVVGAGELPAGVWRWMKTYVSAGSAALVFLSSVLGDGITTAEWAQLVVAVLGAVGVAVVPGPVVVPAGPAPLNPSISED